jgi:hypothetical protein
LNLEPESTKLIRSLFLDHEFFDLAQNDPQSDALDVIVPVLHSNDLWRENLTSFYREIPINRLIIGNAGCIDDTIDIVKKFPRVEIIDHTHLFTLGSSISDLITHVSTAKFAYLQSDVYLPAGWFSAMLSKSQDYAWVGSPMQIVTMLDYRVDYSGHRPLAGAQLGETSVFKNLSSFIDDDFVYRQEDFVLEEYVKREGFQTGNSHDTFHYHQVMRRKTIGMKMNVQSISVNLAESELEKSRVTDSQLYGLIKYCDPKRNEIRSAAYAAYLDRRISGQIHFFQVLKFARNNNGEWSSLIVRFALKSFVAQGVSFLSSWVLRFTDMILRTQ